MTYPPPSGSPDPYQPQQPYGQQPPSYDPNTPYGQDPYGAPSSGAPSSSQPFGAPSSGQPYGAQTSGQPYGDAYKGQPGYGGQPYGQQPYQPVAAPTNTMAILSLVFAFVFAPAGIVMGHVAKKQISTTGESGDGLATAGLWLSYIITGLYVLGCIGYIAIVAFAINSGASSTTY